MDESQPQVSKTAALKQAGLLSTQKEGTRVYQSWRSMKTPTITAAIEEGERMLTEAGVLSQINKVMEKLKRRRAFFEAPPVKKSKQITKSGLPPSICLLHCCPYGALPYWQRRR